MKIDSLKLDIMRWIAPIEDEKLLKTLSSFKKATEDTDWWDSLTPDQIKSIREGLKDLQEGRHISDKKFWERYGKRA